MPRKIITSLIYPPIPIRDCDYIAFFDGEEEDQENYGYGRTEEDAVADLQSKQEEDDGRS